MSNPLDALGSPEDAINDPLGTVVRIMNTFGADHVMTSIENSGKYGGRYFIVIGCEDEAMFRQFKDYLDNRPDME